MTTALQLLEELNTMCNMDQGLYEAKKSQLEREEFVAEFEKVFEKSFEYDRAELKEAVSNYTNEEQDKIYFIKKMYYRPGITGFINKYWDRTAEIIVLIIEKLYDLERKETERI